MRIFSLPLFLLITQLVHFQFNLHKVKMCINSSKFSRRCKPVQIRRIKRKLTKQAKEEKRRKNKNMVKEHQTKMLFKNLELYLENQNIMQENEKLRQKAALLIKENKTLSSQLQKLSQHHLPS